LVLLGTATLLQSNGGLTVSVLPGAENLASSTINVRLAAVRRLAYEASNTGLMSPELAANCSGRHLALKKFHKLLAAELMALRIAAFILKLAPIVEIARKVLGL
jgi:hypothetical protein